MKFESEAALVAAFCALLETPERWGKTPRGDGWTCYHETGGFDLLLAHRDGFQIGIEAKLSLNAKVLCQAIAGADGWTGAGPDYRAVLVPRTDLQGHMADLAGRLGLTVIVITDYGDDYGAGHDIRFSPPLPDEKPSWFGRDDWYSWLPSERVKLPDYIPDVAGGKAAPVRLTEWKQRAIKLLILLDRTGAVTRKDMKALSISPTRFTDRTYGFLIPTEAGYVRGPRTPDLKAQHPRNWAEIEADLPVWGEKVRPGLFPAA